MNRPKCCYKNCDKPVAKRNKQEYDKFCNRHRDLWRLYKLSPEDYDKLYLKQRGCCVICGIHQIDLHYSLVVDHSHKTKKVRGLLCRKCNVMLGMANDDVEILKKGIQYLGLFM